MDFDWAKKSNRHVIQWAAFYGDCEHEILEVTAGHRIIMTYNFYYSHIGDIDRAVHVPHQFPLYNLVRDILREVAFLPNGVDLAIYSVFRNLGFNVGVHPIIKNELYQMGGISYKQLMRDTYNPDRPDHVEYFLRKLEKAQNVADSNRAKNRYCYERENEYTTSVGTELHGPTFKKDAGDGFERVSQDWPHEKVAKIIWMNNPSHEDFAHAAAAFPKYGNNATMTWEFSSAAILIHVPPSGTRLAANGGGLDFTNLSLQDDGSQSPYTPTGLSDSDSDVEKPKATLF
ncbi:MAG: hypothetical protein Q9208_007652 [Pyrenodesmia sp. 3 TL-2023]